MSKRKPTLPLGTNPKDSRASRLATRLQAQQLVSAYLPHPGPFHINQQVYAPNLPGGHYMLAEITGFQVECGTCSVSFHPNAEPTTRDVKLHLSQLIPALLNGGGGTVALNPNQPLRLPSKASNPPLPPSSFSPPVMSIMNILADRLAAFTLERLQGGDTSSGSGRSSNDTPVVIDVGHWCIQGGFPALRYFNTPTAAHWVVTLGLEVAAHLLGLSSCKAESPPTSPSAPTFSSSPTTVRLAVDALKWLRYLLSTTSEDPCLGQPCWGKAVVQAPLRGQQGRASSVTAAAEGNGGLPGSGSSKRGESLGTTSFVSREERLARRSQPQGCVKKEKKVLTLCHATLSDLQLLQPPCPVTFVISTNSGTPRNQQQAGAVHSEGKVAEMDTLEAVGSVTREMLNHCLLPVDVPTPPSTSATCSSFLSMPPRIVALGAVLEQVHSQNRRRRREEGQGGLPSSAPTIRVVLLVDGTHMKLQRINDGGFGGDDGNDLSHHVVEEGSSVEGGSEMVRQVLAPIREQLGLSATYIHTSVEPMERTSKLQEWLGRRTRTFSFEEDRRPPGAGSSSSAPRVLVLDTAVDCRHHAMFAAIAQHGTLFVSWNSSRSSMPTSSTTTVSLAASLALLAQSLQSNPNNVYGFELRDATTTQTVSSSSAPATNVIHQRRVWDQALYDQVREMYDTTNDRKEDGTSVDATAASDAQRKQTQQPSVFFLNSPTTTTTITATILNATNPNPNPTVTDIATKTLRIAELAWPRVLSQYLALEALRSDLLQGLVPNGKSIMSPPSNSLFLLGECTAGTTPAAGARKTTKRNRDEDLHDDYLLEQSHEVKRVTMSPQRGQGPLLVFLTAVSLMPLEEENTMKPSSSPSFLHTPLEYIKKVKVE